MTAYALLLMLSLQSPSARIDDLSWMSGCWTLSANGRTVTEYWLAPFGGTMLGMSRTVANGKTVEHEFIVLRQGDNGLEYVARPSGQSEAVFKATRASGDEVVFENPAHDFPTRITYRRVSGGLKATIDGNMNGKPRAIDFAYVSGGCSK